jgi:hypothetical protein
MAQFSRKRSLFMIRLLFHCHGLCADIHPLRASDSDIKLSVYRILSVFQPCFGKPADKTFRKYPDLLSHCIF